MAARLGLRPWERKRMTPAEVVELYDGYLWRVNALAWAAHLVMATWAKKPPAPKDIHAAMISELEDGDHH